MEPNVCLGSAEAYYGSSPTAKPLHFVLVPLLAPGHMIPMVDLARLLAARGILVTFVTTPVNLSRIQPIAERAAASSLPIRFAELPFPAADVGLPEGCENTDLLPSVDLYIPFMKALPLFRDPLISYLQTPGPAQWPQPACLISDFIQHWTIDVARAINIPHLIFQGPSCFYLVCNLLINRHRTQLQSAMVAATAKSITLPGLPQPIHVMKHDVISAWHADPEWLKIIEAITKAEESSDGVLINSFSELEQWYLERYQEETGKPVWAVGPLSLYKEELDAKAVRGRVSSVDEKLLLRWLGEKDPGSVVFVSFGSVAVNAMAQVMEIGHGLEASTRAFVWVVKEAEERWMVPGLEEWLGEFEKRVEGRGLVIRGWAPQVLILGHVAVGGFVTHCGWSSILEAVAAGVAMATWPHFADQFLNERLVVDVLRIGVSFGVEDPTMLVLKGSDEAVKVRRWEVERVVRMLMDEGEEAKERRMRARRLSEKARRAMEDGGSSWLGLKDVISYVEEREKGNKSQM